MAASKYVYLAKLRNALSKPVVYKSLAALHRLDIVVSEGVSLSTLYHHNFDDGPYLSDSLCVYRLWLLPRSKSKK